MPAKRGFADKYKCRSSVGEFLREFRPTTHVNYTRSLFHGAPGARYRDWLGEVA